VKDKEITQKPESATGDSKLATDLPGLQPMHWMMAYSHLCRRSVANLLKKGLPHIKLGSRILFHPPSVERWMLRQQRGGDQ
jgi:hypothetical protein